MVILPAEEQRHCFRNSILYGNYPQEISEFRVWLLVNEKHKEQLFAKLKELQDQMNQAYDLWRDELKDPKK